jgi:hypothetical protein
MRAHVDLEALMLRLFWSVAVLTLRWALPAHARQDFLPVGQTRYLKVRCA